MACEMIHFADDVDVEEIVNVVEDNEESDFQGMIAFLSS